MPLIHQISEKVQKVFVCWFPPGIPIPNKNINISFILHLLRLWYNPYFYFCTSSRRPGIKCCIILYKFIFTYIFALSYLIVFSQEINPGQHDSVNFTDSLNQKPAIKDTIPELPEVADTLITDTLAVSQGRKRTSSSVIEAPINYNAEDSIVGSFDGQKVYLYNNARVTYQQIELTAYFIELNLETKEVYAEGVTDSTVTLVQKPIFKDGKDEFESQTLRYNFETEKGIIDRKSVV